MYFYRIPNYLKRFFLIFLICAVFYFTRNSFLEGVAQAYSIYSIDGLVAEVLGGITTSVILFIFYIILMPIIEISPKIVKYEDGAFRTKIYNSSIFASHEVTAQFTKVTPIKADNGKKNVILIDVKTAIEYIEYLPSMYNLNARRNGNTFAVVYRVDENEDIEGILSDKMDSSYYRLTISCKNGFTGLRKIITQNYSYKTEIEKDKEFNSGATFRIS